MDTRVHQISTADCRLFERILDSLPHSFYVIDVATRQVVLANRVARDQGTCIGLTCHQATHGRNTPCDGFHVCPLSAVVASGREVTVEHVHTLLGLERTIEVRGIPVVDDDGRVVQMIELGIDVTERRTAERELVRRVAELNRLNTELDAFAQTVAHDFKSPLTALVGYAELLRHPKVRLDAEEAPRQLAAIARLSRRLARMVDGILVLASADREPVTLRPVDMEAAVGVALGSLAWQVEDSNAEIRRGPVPPALGHAPWLESVWTNYIANAIHHGGQPPVVEIGATDLLGGGVRYWVRDNGRGLSPEEQERLFLPFTRSTRIGGHGLGLSIVRRVVERLGGRYDVRSQPGQGAEFGFTLSRPPG